MCVTLCSYLQRSAKNAEALRSEVDELMGHLNHLDQIVQERNLLAQRVRELVAEVERLRSERDESQRLLVEARQANVKKNQTQATHAALRLVLLRSSLRIDPPHALCHRRPGTPHATVIVQAVAQAPHAQRRQPTLGPLPHDTKHPRWSFITAIGCRGGSGAAVAPSHPRGLQPRHGRSSRGTGDRGRG